MSGELRKMKAALPVTCTSCTRIIPVGASYYYNKDGSKRICHECGLFKFVGEDMSDIFKGVFDCFEEEGKQ